MKPPVTDVSVTIALAKSRHLALQGESKALEAGIRALRKLYEKFNMSFAKLRLSRHSMEKALETQVSLPTAVKNSLVSFSPRPMVVLLNELVKQGRVSNLTLLTQLQFQWLMHIKPLLFLRISPHINR